MKLIISILIISLLFISNDGLRIAKIFNANYSNGIPFSTMIKTEFKRCLCECIAHPHCLSITVSLELLSTFICRLFATYPMKSSQLSFSSTSYVMINVDRTMNSVYMYNGSELINPKNLFSNYTDRWIPAFKLLTGNNQTFLWFNSTNATELIQIPKIFINQTESHWFNILLTQWNENSYIPNEIALAFIVNQTKLFEFLIFNSSQKNIFNWFNLINLLSRQYWAIYSFQGTMQIQTHMKPIYNDDFSIRSFNANFKSPDGCQQDFYGFFFVYGGFRDVCLTRAIQNMSKLSIPTIFYSPTMTITNGNFTFYRIADSIMGFVR